MNEAEILQTFSLIGPYGFGAAAAYFMRPLWGALASRITKNGNGLEKRVDKIQNNDMKHIEEDVRSIRKGMSDLQRTCSDFGQRIARIEGRLNGKQ